MKLSLILKQLLKENDLTIMALSRVSAVPSQTIHNWLSGAEPRNVKQLKSVASALHVDLDYLCFGETKNITSSDHLFEEIKAGVFEVILRKPIK